MSYRANRLEESNENNTVGRYRADSKELQTNLMVALSLIPG